MTSRLDMPAVNGRPVTEGHVRICQEHGHAHRIVNGVDMGVCPRCGVVTVMAGVR